ncbi:hypothetical protein [Peribacillus butanolivorans]|uniref:hypothetical protein n=1 Tax=Peribacillus butanolivorans TaxID=421767 RepID=UPI003670F22E
MNIKKFGLYALLAASIPVAFNYVLLSWKAPGLEGETSDWFSFFGNYLGFIGAVSIALFQMRKQNKRDFEQDLESKRSFIVVNDFNGRLKLENLKTHEDSRIIYTPGYKDILKRTGKGYNTVDTTYLKLSHFGNSPIILDCKIFVDSKNESGEAFQLNENIGVIEQGIEVFVPIVPPNAKIDELLTVDVIKIEYKTLMNETMRYVIDHLTNKEYYCVVNVKGNEDKIYEQEITSASWTYPNKIKQTES